MQFSTWPAAAEGEDVRSPEDLQETASTTLRGDFLSVSIASTDFHLDIGLHADVSQFFV